MTAAARRTRPKAAPAPARNIRRISPKRTVAVDPIDFELEFGSDEGPQVHGFTAAPRLDWSATVGLTGGGEAVAKLPVLDRFIRKSMVNNDGTPAKWAPRDAGDGLVYGPSGDRITAGQAAELEAFDAGSSRRRWIALMDPDNSDVTIELEQIMELFEMLTAEVGDRPT